MVRNINITFPFEMQLEYCLTDFSVISIYFIEGAIKIPTVSISPEELNTTAMAEFGNYIQEGTQLPFLSISAQFYFHKLKSVYVVLEYNGTDRWFVFPLERTVTNAVYKSLLEQCTFI